ncbi:MAG: aldehyde dehydrogenase family protein [Fimbriimonadaceae bacterium]|nr:aldehyde dehydrogenase family protein [Fimbriimonadaceae bacterium]
MHQELLINGVFIGGPCDQSIGKTQHYAPYDGALVGTAAEAGWSEVTAAIDAAKTAFETWRFSKKADRAKLLKSIGQTVRERKEELATLMAQEIGKPVTQARAEVDRLALTFELSAELAVKDHTRTIDVSYDPRDTGLKCTSERFPIGPILAIVPYNWPYNLAAHKIAPALAAGNTVVVKTPSMGTLCTLALGRIIHECGCPDGVVNVLNMPSALAQKAAQDERIAMLSFTGSPKVGWMLKELLPKKKVALELGGDATAIVAADADIEKALKELPTAAFAYAGQICISLQHILVQESLYESFKTKFLSAVEEIQTGDPLDESTICGPVISDDVADKVMELLSSSEDAGATILTGGSRIGNVIEPTVLEGITRDHTLGREEAFAPLVTLQSYSTDEEAIEWVNASQFGIHASLYTTEKSRVQRYYEEIEIGGLIINNPPSLRFDAMPYGGVKNSGFGREGVENTFHEMTEEKLLLKD